MRVIKITKEERKRLKILFLQILSHLNFNEFLSPFYRSVNGFREVK